MIFSQWNPDGGYRYFETDQRHPIGDEVPSKVPAVINNIGAPSNDVGVQLPKGAKFIGEGTEPIGVIVPMRRNGYRTLGATPSTEKEKQTSNMVVFLFVTGVVLLAGLGGRDVRRR